MASATSIWIPTFKKHSNRLADVTPICCSVVAPHLNDDRVVMGAVFNTHLVIFLVEYHASFPIMYGFKKIHAVSVLEIMLNVLIVIHSNHET